MKNPALPMWLSPTQVRLCPISDKHIKYSERIAEELEKECIRVDIDDRRDTMQKKIRDAELAWIPIVCVIGDKEMKNKTLTARFRDEKIKEINMKELVKTVKEETTDNPFRTLPIPKLLSKRPVFA
jgi:threonyl-tRNA synthetase